MYAIIQAKDKQYRVEEGQRIVVEKIEGEPESPLSFDKVLFLKKGENDYQAGAPYVAGAKVTAKVLKHFKDDKVVIFKKKRRKNHRKKQGHRQNYTLLVIEKIQA